LWRYSSISSSTVGDADIARWSQRLEFFADALVDVEVVEQIAEVVEGNALPAGEILHALVGVRVALAPEDRLDGLADPRASPPAPRA